MRPIPLQLGRAKQRCIRTAPSAALRRASPPEYHSFRTIAKCRSDDASSAASPAPSPPPSYTREPTTTPRSLSPVSQPFAPRTTFSAPATIPRSYYLGHHASALSKMSLSISTTGLILSVRDMRVPLTSWNPILEQSLQGPPQIIVYTKKDLCVSSPHLEPALRRIHASRPGDSVFFSGKDEGGRNDKAEKKRLLAKIREVARDVDGVTGLRMLITGMPNVGKSTLLNRLSLGGAGGRRKAVARTGEQPGITRKLESPVRILGGKGADPSDGDLGQGVYVIDTPGVFVPYVSDPEAMLKLALVHGIKDNIVPLEIVADYLLYKLNLWDPALYGDICAPTNDVDEFLAAVAKRTGKIQSSRTGNDTAAAAWVIGRWRRGLLGRYGLDDVNEEVMEKKRTEGTDGPISMNRARKLEKERRKAAKAAKFEGTS